MRRLASLMRQGFGASWAWWQKALLIAGFSFLFLGLVIFTYFYVHYSRIIDARLSGDIFADSSLVFAAPTEVRVGEPITAAEVAERLRKAFYAESERGSNVGSYQWAGNRLEIHPGAISFFKGDQVQEGPAAIDFKDGRIAAITSLDQSQPLENYWLEPELITTLFDRDRSKRRLVRYQDLPKPLVNAVLAAEDHRFFSHYGISLIRVFGAALADLRGNQGLQGGSTLTMQVARMFFLSRDRTWSVKMRQGFLALMLEQRLSKEQIFELYANQIYLGQRGSFSVYGFGEAADAYFSTDVSSLTLPQAAVLAALIRGPNLYSPYKYPERALERRNLVLRRMVETGFIAQAEADRAEKAPLGLTQRNEEGSQAPYFVDMVREELLSQFPERDLLTQSYRIYTTLDLDLQRAASEGARLGIADVDKTINSRRRKNSLRRDPLQPQLALVALDPHTGVVRALVGGRDYGASQLNHALAKRQPGSSFKPFVYAAALSSGVDGSQPLITPATILKDEPTTFNFGDQAYMPEDYKQEYHGQVTVRQALMLSLNVATVSLAEMVGYGKVRALAIEAGINKDIGSTPALALGAYVATPMEMAGAYTIFSNSGQYVAPRCILTVHDSTGHLLWDSPIVKRSVLDPRVSYLMVNLMESVINNGTGYPARARGFTVPAAGKTGTSQSADGWFAGFTSNLLAVAWVGYDDNSKLNLTGASSALPIWTEFMKRAVASPTYQNVQEFVAPAGIVTASVSNYPILSVSTEAGTAAGAVLNSGQGTTRDEVFIEGTQPAAAGGLGNAPAIIEVKEGASAVGRILNEILHGGLSHAEAKKDSSPAAGNPAAAATQVDPNPGTVKPKKKGVVKKFLSIFGGKSSTPSPPPAKDAAPQ